VNGATLVELRMAGRDVVERALAEAWRIRSAKR
jgi:hypothetical protein